MYVAWRNDIAGSRYYSKGNGKRTHSFTAGSEQAIRHWVFRDYLRKHHGVAQQYAATQCNAKQQKTTGKTRRLMAG
ncbi:GrpB family protein [Serratia sp. FDAARGOS_506]|uniref:GrpB family protein n=1 Tax=Serratia sp. FDAARGOS_506 TaxID=2420306 RepID=UPI000F4E4372|nr:hypothetical protein EGY12_18765 [Serratia sp. FDAARGOS_506]